MGLCPKEKTSVGKRTDKGCQVEIIIVFFLLIKGSVHERFSARTTVLAKVGNGAGSEHGGHGGAKGGAV